MIKSVLARNRKAISMTIIFLSAIMLGILLFVSFYTGLLRMNYPDKKEFPIRGIDISHHQAAIDWESLSQEDIQFVFMKATEGGDFKDTLFHDNWRRADDAGLIRGAYHFFTFCRSGKEQAQNFIETVPVERGALPPAIDLEFPGNCRERPEKDVVLQELKAFISEIENRYGQTPVLYVTYATYEAYLRGELGHMALWIRDIYSRPSLPDNRDWRFWQYTHRGRLKGINTFVDLNVFRGTQEDFAALTAP